MAHMLFVVLHWWRFSRMENGVNSWSLTCFWLKLRSYLYCFFFCFILHICNLLQPACITTCDSAGFFNKMIQFVCQKKKFWLCCVNFQRRSEKTCEHGGNSGKHLSPCYKGRPRSFKVTFQCMLSLSLSLL